MSNIEIWLLAVSLAMDCFSISVASSIIVRRFDWRLFFKMAFFFGLFQAAMPIIGWLGASYFSGLIEAYDHWIAFALLAFLGVRMIIEGCKSEEEANFDPTQLKVLLTLAVATSIDALAIGISFAFVGIRSIASLTYPVVAIGITSFVLSLVGSLIGAYAGRKFKFRMEPVGGIVLICLGIKILLEHLNVL